MIDSRQTYLAPFRMRPQRTDSADIWPLSNAAVAESLLCALPEKVTEFGGADAEIAAGRSRTCAVGTEADTAISLYRFWRYRRKHMSRLSQLGHSIGLRLPKNIVECAHLKVGDIIHARLLDTGDILLRREGGAVDHVPIAENASKIHQAIKEPTAAEVLAQW